jgi:hypothetical protein
MKINKYWCEISLLVMFIVGCFAYILFDRHRYTQRDRDRYTDRREGFKMPKQISIVKNNIKSKISESKSQVVGGASSLFSDKVFNNKNNKVKSKSMYVKEGICLPKTSQLKKNYPELNKVLMILSKTGKAEESEPNTKPGKAGKSSVVAKTSKAVKSSLETIKSKNRT